ncbi:hypothetical protein [Coprococcus hominis (ex Arizal et al. 2022)]|uniref:hypothetical protein n=1 Tax=Coprococcus hominis (ex Arizal et al. 2022) TaxID=2881262 RepID=UPI0032BF4139
MLLSVLHVIAFVLIVLAVIMYNFVLPESRTKKVDRIAIALIVVVWVLCFALLIYDKVVVG